ncbi:MAG: aromatic acid/H+ symport family MFS transporter [Nocardiopsaceae bacterium]|nr:aromatic acid/H+ symport family MFS transporter [Nocardiopsaceae bacterium]
MSGSPAPRHSRQFALCWLTVLLEGFDLVALGATSLALRHAPHLQMTSPRLTLVSTLSLTGVAIGSAFFAPLGDVVGRRKVLMGSVASFSVFTLIVPLSPNIGVFAALRLLAGLGLGACMPVALTSMSECWPTVRRTKANTITMTGYHVGAVLASLLALAVTKDWQVLFYVNGVAGLILVAIMQFKLEETRVGPRPAPESGATVPDLLKPRYLRTTIAVWVATFMGLILVYGLNTWIPTLMKTAGYSVSASVTLLFVLNAGGIAGMLLAGYAGDSRGISRTAFAWFGAAAVLLAVLSIKLHVASLLDVLIFLTGVFAFSAQVVVFTYVSEAYPALVRGSALGLASGVGRIGAIVGPFITGVLVSSGVAYPWGFYFFAAAALLGVAAMAAAPRVTRPSNAGNAGSQPTNPSLNAQET